MRRLRAVIRGFRSRRRWALAILALSGVVLCGAASYPVLSGRTEVPRFSLGAAEHALADARRARADRWAPESMMRAEAAMRAARVEQRRQEVRFLLLRDFSTTRASLGLAEDKARAALADAAKNRDAARSKADAAVGRAESTLSGADEFADAIHLGVVERKLLQKAKISLAEAKILYGQGEYVFASDRADSATNGGALVGSRAASVASRFTDEDLVRRWRRMADETISWSRSTGAEAVVVYKENHRLTLFDGGRPVRSYRVELGYNSTSDKVHSGDAATPEGRYRITAKKGAGDSTYYKALLLNYPNDEDRVQFERARRAGSIPRWARVGGLIEIHGDGGRGKDWTKGCIALANDDIDDLFRKVAVGTPVTIVGSDGRGGAFTELVRRYRTPGNGATSQ